MLFQRSYKYRQTDQDAVINTFIPSSTFITMEAECLPSHLTNSLRAINLVSNQNNRYGEEEKEEEVERITPTFNVSSIGGFEAFFFVKTYDHIVI